MRSVSIAKKELKLLKLILDEFLQDYEHALNEDVLSKEIHNHYSTKIGEAYWKYKDLEKRLSAF
ncbi:MAG: hypothetical protein JXQ87_07745 [Bacteroidia bacterium]